MLNDQGWIATAGHILNTHEQATNDAPKVAALRAEIATVTANPKLQPSQKHSQIRRIEGRADRTWITAANLWWADNGARIAEGVKVGELDIAVIRLDPFPARMAANVAEFRVAPEPLPQGKSLCRLGFPFHSITPTFDEATDTFDLGAPVLTYFPNDGILTRGIDGGMTADGKHRIVQLETSTPGIPGQSGGPVFDIDGKVWGIQVSTASIQLGFAPKVTTPDGRGVVEHQVMNLGRAISALSILSVLDDLGVSYTKA